jgi:chromosome segregation ATPase
VIRVEFLTPVGSTRYDSPDRGGDAIPADERDFYDWGRLEEAISNLVESRDRLQRENRALRRDLENRDRRLRLLDGQLLEANQKRKDIAKRIDELITQIDFLDTRLAEPEVTAS